MQTFQKRFTTSKIHGELKIGKNPKRDLELLPMFRKVEKHCQFFRKSVLSFYKKTEINHKGFGEY